MNSLNLRAKESNLILKTTDAEAGASPKIRRTAAQYLAQFAHCYLRQSTKSDDMKTLDAWQSLNVSNARAIFSDFWPRFHYLLNNFPTSKSDAALSICCMY